MLKRLIHRALNACGYRISRIPPAQPPAPPQWPVEPGELATLMAELERFAREKPGRGPWSEPSRAREYLSDKRLCFFRDLMGICQRHNVGFAGADVADIGSGTGYLLRLIHEAAPDARLTGYDTYGDIVELARALCPSARFVLKDFFEIEGDRYDVIFNTEVLEHLFRPDLALAHMLGLLNGGGTLILTVPNGRTDTFDALGPLDNGKGHWGHINFWSPESWPIFVRQHIGDAKASFGTLATGENFAVIRKPPA